MIKSRRRRGAQLGMLAAVALSIGSIGAASASATSQQWMEFTSGVTPATVSGTLQLTNLLGGHPVTPVSCPVLTTGAPNYSTPQAFTGGFNGMSRQTCSNGKQFEVDVTFVLTGTPGSWSVVLWPGSNTAKLSPFTVGGTSTTWWQASMVTVPLTNGAGSVPTKLTFNNTKLGYQYSSTNGVYATGTLDVNTPGGGTLTVGLR